MEEEPGFYRPLADLVIERYATVLGFLAQVGGLSAEARLRQRLAARSASLNTEMGVVIDGPDLAGALAEWFDTRVPLLAYAVKLTDEGDLYWIERTEAGEKRYDTEPEAGFFLRSWVGFLSILPIEREL